MGGYTNRQELINIYTASAVFNRESSYYLLFGEKSPPINEKEIRERIEKRFLEEGIYYFEIGSEPEFLGADYKIPIKTK